ncbi:MAG: hypothetical protein AAF493_05505 [Pseudomonadota bacterium]
MRPHRCGARRVIAVVVLAIVATPVWGAVYIGDPQTYRPMVANLKPGDELRLRPGIYRDGLSVNGLVGTAERRITIHAEDPERRPIFWGRAGRNLISVRGSEFITIANLVLDGRNAFVSAVKQEGGAQCRPSRNVEIRGLFISGFRAHQQQVGISTKCMTVDWHIHHNTILGAGTGIYLGNANGDDAFIGGLIEHNLVLDSIGYNLQLKHQFSQPPHPWIQSAAKVTVIRHNVFSKQFGASTEPGRVRPNVLVGAKPATGRGASDRVELYGNFFHHNPGEALFQAEGDIAIHNNVFVNPWASNFPAIAIQPHNGTPRSVRIFYNTVIANGVGLSVQGAPTYLMVRGNAIFASLPFRNHYFAGNFVAAPDAARAFLRRPFGPSDARDYRPRWVWRESDIAIPGALLSDLIGGAYDFDGLPRQRSSFGAYARSNRGESWSPGREFKVLRPRTRGERAAAPVAGDSSSNSNR